MLAALIFALLTVDDMLLQAKSQVTSYKTYCRFLLFLFALLLHALQQIILLLFTKCLNMRRAKYARFYFKRA